MTKNREKEKSISKLFWMFVSVIGLMFVTLFFLKFLLIDEGIFVTIVVFISTFAIALVAVLLGTCILNSNMPKHSQVVLILVIACVMLYLVLGKLFGDLTWLSDLYRLLKTL